MDLFHPPGWLKNAHLQSVLNSVKLRRPLVYHRARHMRRVAVPHILDCGGSVRLQGFYSGHGGSPGDLCVLIHGWEGSADSSYLVSAAGFLWDRGVDVFRLNLRDHGGTHHLNKGLFHSCRINEVVGAVQAVDRTLPHRRLFLGGFSLGGNFALRVAARAPGAGIRLDRAAAVCPVLNPAHTMKAMENGLFIYHWYFMRKWRRSLQRKAASFPETEGLQSLPRFQKISTMTEYFVQRFTDFPDLRTYLNGYTITGGALAGLEIPSVIIASTDDPIIPSNDLKKLAHSDSLTIQLVPHGGHCGFLENFRLKSWADRKLAEVFEGA